MEQLSYVFTQYFVVCVHVRFYFSLPLIFILLAASISHFFTAAMLFSLQNTSPLFSITRSSSFSVNHVRIKNNAEKDKTFFLFFLSKSPGGHVKTWVAFGLPYLLIELLYIGIRADKGWAVKRARPSKKVWCSGLGLCLDMLLVFDFGQGFRCGLSIRYCRCHWIMAAWFVFFHFFLWIIFSFYHTPMSMLFQNKKN